MLLLLLLLLLFLHRLLNLFHFIFVSHGKHSSLSPDTKNKRHPYEHHPSMLTLARRRTHRLGTAQRQGEGKDLPVHLWQRPKVMSE